MDRRGGWRLTPMSGRDRNDTRRTTTPFELFFDLVFVVAVSFASESLFDLEGDGQLWTGLGAYAMVFFAIWWAWMNFTWFATAFDTDDWLYRAVTLVQMAGALVLAAGTSPAIHDGDFTVVTWGYAVMTLAIAFQWFRAAIEAPHYRAACLRHGIGALIVQGAWIGRLLLPPEWGVPVFFVLVLAELSVPVISDRAVWTPSNPRHVAERYGLFTLIVLGEAVLASTQAVITALQTGEHTGTLLTIAVSGLLTVSAMWWLYFAAPTVNGFRSFRSSFLYGYGHYFVFASAGAVSAGIEVAVHHAADVYARSAPLNAATLTLPVAVFVAAVWALAIRPQRQLLVSAGTLIAIVAILAVTFAPGYPVLIALIMVALITLVVLRLPTATDSEETVDVPDQTPSPQKRQCAVGVPGRVGALRGVTLRGSRQAHDTFLS